MACCVERIGWQMARRRGKTATAMTAPPVAWPTADDALTLFNQLLVGDATAPAEFVALFFHPLRVRLRADNPRIDEHLCDQAAGDALLAIVKNPHQFDRSRGTVPAYVSMAARGDLLNALARERKHRHAPLDSVELSSVGRKYLERNDDPSLPLRIVEETPVVPDAVRNGLTPEQSTCLDLLIDGVRRNDDYAAALGLMDSPKMERDREVKRVKDMLKKRLKRTGGGRGPVD